METYIVIIVVLSILSLVFIIYCIYWMGKILKYTKKNCVSLLLMNKVIFKYLKDKDVDLDFYLIQDIAEKETENI